MWYMAMAALKPELKNNIFQLRQLDDNNNINYHNHHAPSPTRVWTLSYNLYSLTMRKAVTLTLLSNTLMCYNNIHFKVYVPLMNFFVRGNESVLRPVTSIPSGTDISRFSQREKGCDFVIVFDIMTKEDEHDPEYKRAVQSSSSTSPGRLIG
ncbi:hypothetical protein CFP56_027557 [Quercus suber]|uniref:Uncharacterized protein n=1 Tax=Quercus suber TaxID=58331 RepID=A0AAW0JWX3_QUESU